MTIVWTDYLKYRASIRGFDLNELERILKQSSERYMDTETGSLIVVGRHKGQMVMIAYDASDDEITPITVHSITRQQVQFRVRAGRFANE
ncbi:MAG: hypothetical protein AAF702_23405 [Chloroflexota bacterium]